MLRNRPALAFSIPFVAGILTGWEWNFYAEYIFASALMLFVLAGLFVVADWNLTKQAVPPILLLLVFLTGILKITLDKNPPEKRELERLLDTPYQVIISGFVADPPREQFGRIRFVLDAERVVWQGGESAVSASVLVSMEADSLSQAVAESMEYGSPMQFEGTLTYPGTARNPREFDLRHYLQLQGIYARSFIEDPSTIVFGNKKENESPFAGWIFANVVYPMRKAIMTKLDDVIGGEEARFLKGLIVGDRSEISPDVKTSFINSGVMHILAVSGLHVGMISLMLVVILTALRIPEIPRSILICLLLVLYVLLTGSSPSVIRAGVMAIVVFGARVFDRKSDIMNSLAVAALFILFWDSRQLLMAGFQLSFIAVFSIVLLYPVFFSWSKSLPERLTGNWLVNGTIQLTCLSVAAGLGTLPFTALYFGKIPVVGFVANLIAVPLSGIVLAAGMTATSFSFVWDAAATLYADAAKFLTALLLDSVTYFGNLSVSYVDAYFSSFNIISYYVVVAFVVNIGAWPLKRTFIVLLVLGNVMLYGWIFGFIGKSDLLRVTFLDVGQGDAVFVEFPDGKNMLVDAGPREFFADAGSRFVTPFLKASAVSHLEALVVSHPHNDHIGGIPAVLREVSVSSVIDAGSYAKSTVFDEYLRLKDSAKASRHVLRGGLTIDGYANVRIYLLHPTAEFTSSTVDSSARDLNNESLVMRIVFGETSILLAGDAEEEAEAKMVQRYDRFLRSDVLKVGHHGSNTSSTQLFLTAVGPDMAIISVGKNNKFHHPSQSVLDRLAAQGVRTYRTDEQNAVILVSDGREWREEKWR